MDNTTIEKALDESENTTLETTLANEDESDSTDQTIEMETTSKEGLVTSDKNNDEKETKKVQLVEKPKESKGFILLKIY